MCSTDYTVNTAGETQRFDRNQHFDSERNVPEKAPVFENRGKDEVFFITLKIYLSPLDRNLMWISDSRILYITTVKFKVFHV